MSMGRLDKALLAAAAALGLAATFISHGADGAHAQAAMLAAASILALRPLVRLVKGKGSERERRAWILAAVFFAHVIATFLFFPPGELLNSRPVVTLDHALHYQQVERSVEVFWKSFRFHAYDPWFMAGYPAGTIFDIDSKGIELWCAILSFAGTARAFKLYIMLGYLLLVPAVYAGCRRLGYSFEESVLALLVLLAFWHWGRPYVGEFRFAGMFSFLIVCYLSLYMSGLARSFLREERIARFWILGPAIFLIHPTSAVILPVPFLALLIAERGTIRSQFRKGRWGLRLAARTLAWCLLIMAVNSIWLVPLFRYIDMKIPSEAFFQINGLQGLVGILVKAGNLPALGLLVLAAIGFFRMIRSGRSAAAAASAAAGMYLLMISAYGIYIPVFDQMEPGRFLVPALILISPMAGAGLVAAMRSAGRMVPERGAARTLAVAILIALLLCSPAFAFLATRSYYRHHLHTTFTPQVMELIDALESRTDPSGRLMIEDGPAWNYGDTFLPAMLPHMTGVEQIGGPYPWTFMKHNFSNFYMCKAMDRPLEETDPDVLRKYIDLYNIRWVLTATPECGDFFEGFLGEPPSWSSRHFRLWRIAWTESHAAEDMLQIRAAYDEIHVTVTSDTEIDSVMLPYHWDRGLEVDPPSVIRPEIMLDDPVPMILLEPRGETDIKIRFKGWSR